MGEQMMKILVTGALGFIGRNLISELERREDLTVLPFDRDDGMDKLKQFCKECDFVFNLAGINRPEKEEEFMEGNYDFALTLMQMLEESNNTCPIVFSSSIQATLENSYGKSKKAGEEALFSYGKRLGVPVYVYRLWNVFGKWCRPNYNSAVATFCNNIARGLPIQVNDRNTIMHLIYIDDLVQEFIGALEGHPHMNLDGYCFVPIMHEVTLGEITNYLYSFR
jgi:UDP-2-acetamido-2,6-beta-L-arabino-hexul-4-ose reductase